MMKKRLQLFCIWIILFLFTACGSVEDLFETMPEEEAVSVEATALPEAESVVGGVSENKEETISKDTEGKKEESGDTSEILQAEQTAESKLIYDLTEADIAEFDNQRELCKEMIKSSKSYEEVESEIEKLYETALKIQDKITVSEILYYCHMNDTNAVKNYLEGTERLSQLILDYNELLLEVYHDDNTEYQKFFEDWSELELKLLTCPSETSMELEVRNATLLTELYALDELEANEQVGKLYSEFVNNSNLIAKEYDYENYYDYASEAVYMRDYGKEERELFRENVKQYIVPIYNVVAIQYEKYLYDLSLGEADCLMDILFKDMEELSEDYLGRYVDTLSPDMKAGMKHMFEKNNYILTDAEDAYVGAFTANIGEPFCFFGPDSQTIFVIIHELGHYYADLCMEEELMSFDLAETQSQGNEMLFLSYLKRELPQKVYDTLLLYQLYNFTNVIIQSTMFDEFEEYVYNIPDISDYTTADYDRIMNDIVLSYGVDDPYQIIPEGMLWLWKNVGIESPVYYLSYAVSATAALNLYVQSMENYEVAVEAYRKLQEEVDYESGFMKAMENAGMTDVFAEQSFINLLGLLENK